MSEIKDILFTLWTDSGFSLLGADFRQIIMIGVACVLLYLGIVKKFEPLMMVGIAFGALLTNLPGAEMYHEILFAGGHVHWDLFGGAPITAEFLRKWLLWASLQTFWPLSPWVTPSPPA